MAHAASHFANNGPKPYVRFFRMNRLREHVLTIRAATVAGPDPLAALLAQSDRHGEWYAESGIWLFTERADDGNLQPFRKLKSQV